MRVAYQKSKLLIWLHLAARLVNRDKDLIATTDAHHRPVRVHAQRPGKGLQAKQSESLRAQDSAIQKPDQNRNNMSHSLQSALGTKLLKCIIDNYEVNIFKVLAIIYRQFQVETIKLCRTEFCTATLTKDPYFRGITLHRQSITQTEHPNNGSITC